MPKDTFTLPATQFLVTVDTGEGREFIGGAYCDPAEIGTVEAAAREVHDYCLDRIGGHLTFIHKPYRVEMIARDFGTGEPECIRDVTEAVAEVVDLLEAARCEGDEYVSPDADDLHERLRDEAAFGVAAE